MIPVSGKNADRIKNLSRVCGDDPSPIEIYKTYEEFVPRMRG